MPALSLHISKTCHAEKALFLPLADWLTTPVLGKATFFKNIPTQKRIASILVGWVESWVRGRKEKEGARPAKRAGHRMLPLQMERLACQF